MNSTRYSILITLYSILVKGKRHNCEPSPNKIIELLKSFHSIKIGRRWFFQCCRNLEDAGYISRQRRHRHTTDIGILSLPSSWVFCFKGLQYLKKNLVIGAKELARRMIDYLHRDDNRFPRPSHIFPGEEIKERSEALARLQEFIAGIGNGPARRNGPART